MLIEKKPKILEILGQFSMILSGIKFKLLLEKLLKSSITNLDRKLEILSDRALGAMAHNALDNFI
jgi:hypothetical protein